MCLLLTETKTPMRKSREWWSGSATRTAGGTVKTRNRKLSFGSAPHFRVLAEKQKAGGMNVLDRPMMR